MFLFSSALFLIRVRSVSPQTCLLAVFSYCIPPVVLHLLLLATGSGDPVSFPLPDPPSGGLLRCPIPSGWPCCVFGDPYQPIFSSLHPPLIKHRCYCCGRGSTAASSSFGVFATLPYRVALFWLGLVVVLVLPHGRIASHRQ